MKLNEFEDYFDDVILNRGMDYYSHGNVVKIEALENNRYIVEVSGSENYKVGITIDKNQNIDSYCDCPYDWGEYCKHQAAAFFALREEVFEVDQSSGKQTSKKASKKVVSLDELLSNFKKEKLVSIIVDLSEEYPQIEKELLFKYAPTKDEISNSKKLIKEYINKYKHRGFIEWKNVDKALKGANMTLEKAAVKKHNGDPEAAVLLCLIVLPITVDMLQYCDDSSGFVGSAIDESLHIIHDSVSNGIENLDEGDQGTLFTAIYKEAMHKRYDGWTDWRIALLRTSISFSKNKNIREELEKQFERMLNTITNDSWSGKYEIENLKLLQLELLDHNNEKEKAQQFIENNIEYSAFREKAIVSLMKNGDYQEVVKLCNEGLELDKEYRGLVNQWKQYLLHAYEALGDTKKQHELMIGFLYSNDFSYYLKLKRLYSSNAWEPIQKEILEHFEKQPYPPSAYIEILKEEKMYRKLLDYCKDHPFYIQYLHPYLIKDYFEDVNAIYKKYIEIEANESSDRRKYKKVCKLIKEYKNVCGDIHARTIINELKVKYNKRPAFVDELGKIK